MSRNVCWHKKSDEEKHLRLLSISGVFFVMASGQLLLPATRQTYGADIQPEHLPALSKFLRSVITFRTVE